MKKIFLSIAMCVSIISLMGCSSDTTDKSQDYPVKTVNDIKMTIKKIETTENGKGDKNNVRITMDFANQGTGEYGIGGGDFQLQIGKKTYKVDPEANNIGALIPADKSMEGALNYEVPKDAEKATLKYEPIVPENQKTKELASWDIIIPKNK